MHIINKNRKKRKEMNNYFSLISTLLTNVTMLIISFLSPLANVTVVY
jgi:hypothetical protein